MPKIAFITGANKGIGLETARQLGAQNHIILVGSRDAKRGQEAAQTLQNEGIDARSIALDPTDAVSVEAAAREVEAQFGHLDILINNAGTMLDEDHGPSGQLSSDALRETFEINVFGLHEVTRAFWPLLEKSAAARLVNVSSALGSLTLHSSGALGDYKPTAYDASKAAVNMLTTHYAHQWRDTPHRANAIHPGSVKTDLNPRGDLSLEEGAKTSVQLALIPDDGPNGTFSHLGQPLPW